MEAITGVSPARFDPLKLWSRLGLLLVNVGFWALFAALADGFLSDFNLFTLLRLTSIQIVIGLAQMVVLAIGDMNLAVGAIGGVVAMFTGAMLQLVGLPLELALPLGLAVGVLAGVANGVLISLTRINSFIITLATAGIFTGLMLILTEAHSYSALPFSWVGFSGRQVFGLAMISPYVPIMLAVAVALFFLYRSTRLGREMLAVGANRRAAAMSGVAVSRIVIVTHGLSGGLAALAGLMTVGLLGTAAPVIGNDWLLTSFVAPVVGGTLLSGGIVSVWGTVLGGVLVGTITNGLFLLGVSSFWLNTFFGLVLLAAVWLDRLGRVAAGTETS
jgi:ribose transport system permease protein